MLLPLRSGARDTPARAPLPIPSWRWCRGASVLHADHARCTALSGTARRCANVGAAHRNAVGHRAVAAAARDGSIPTCAANTLRQAGRFPAETLRKSWRRIAPAMAGCAVRVGITRPENGSSSAAACTDVGNRVTKTVTGAGNACSLAGIRGIAAARTRLTGAGGVCVRKRTRVAWEALYAPIRVITRIAGAAAPAAIRLLARTAGPAADTRNTTAATGLRADTGGIAIATGGIRGECGVYDVVCVRGMSRDRVDADRDLVIVRPIPMADGDLIGRIGQGYAADRERPSTEKQPTQQLAPAAARRQ